LNTQGLLEFQLLNQADSPALRATQLLESTAFRLTPRKGLHTLGSTLLNGKLCGMPQAVSANPMAFIARILRFLFWVLIVSWSVSLLRRLVNSMGAAVTDRQQPIDVPGNVPSGAVSRKLVRDPVCGMHLAEGLAIAERSGGEPVYFCSEECRNKFMDEPRKFAANA
jgi:YHS domain-containing protein